jgi:ATPase subunit of ABC transporter with duplicated ATPase domains
MIRAVVIVIIVVAVVGTAQSADLEFTPPKRVIPDDGKRQATLKKQQAIQKQNAELKKHAAQKNREKLKAIQKQQAAIERRGAQKKQAELDKQKAEREKQQAELEKQKAEREKQQTELEKQETDLALPKPTAASSITCDAARKIVADLGFEDVKAELCTGDTFGFVAMRDGKSFSIEILAANGEVTKVERRTSGLSR